MTAPEHFQAIVIGSGQGGTPLCVALAEAGVRTALIERAHVGGTCVNDGCTPTKTMVASARVAELARRSAGYGVITGEVRIDAARIGQRTREMVEQFRDGNQRRLDRTKGLELIRGEAHFTGPRSIAVRMQNGSERPLTADKFFIDAGTRPSVPPIEGLTDVPFLDNRSIMKLDRIPEHLLILGGGYVGLEFGQMFRRFGSRVTIVQASEQLLPREDPDVAAEVAAILRQDGIEVLLDARATRVTQSGERLRVAITLGDEVSEREGTHLLVATGRTPNTDTLNVEAAGITTRNGFITVNGALETNQPGIYALGDINGGPAFTHISYDDYRILKTNHVNGGAATTDGRMLPYTVYIDPQLGRVGITEAEAQAQKRTVRIAKMPMSSVARALETDETRGFMKAIVDANTGQILGAAILGTEGGEVMSMLQLAMMGNLPYTRLRDGVFAHPTWAESLNNLFARLDP